MITAKLLPYQREAAERIARMKSMLLADQPGLGKTFTSLGALEISGALTAGGIVLIIGPVITCDTAWVPTIKTQMPEVNVIDGFTGSRAKRDKRIRDSLSESKPNIIVTNHESIGIDKLNKPHVKALHELHYTAILIDESHAVLPTKEDYPALVTQFWRGLYSINDKDEDILRIAISGTPDRGKPYYRFGTWRFLMPIALGFKRVQYQDWLKRHFYVYDITIPVKRDGRQFEVTVQKIGHMLNPAKWIELDHHLMVRRTKREVASQLPNKQYVDVDIPFTAALITAYGDYVHNVLLEDDGSVGNALVFALRAMQFATCQWNDVDGAFLPISKGESPKRDWLVHWLHERNLHNSAEELPESKVVISSQFTKVLNWLKEELHEHGITSEIISGDTPPARRKSIQEQFQDPANPLRVVLLSATLGVGIDLDAADDLIFIDIPRNPDIQEQVEDRIHRVSRVHQVTIWRLRSRGTIDMVIAAKNDDTYNETRALMDGVRSVEFERNVLARIGIR